jgi:hypothetical protein
MPMDDDVKERIATILAIALSATVAVSAASIIGHFAVQQRHAFLLKCMDELGSNNIELCSSIAK